MEPNTDRDTARQVFGEWLKRQIAVSGYSQSEVAEKVGIDRVQLSRIVTGQSGTKKETIEKICELIGADKYMAFRKLKLVPESEHDEDIFLVFHLKKGERVPVQITDPEVLEATRKAIVEQLKTE